MLARALPLRARKHRLAAMSSKQIENLEEQTLEKFDIIEDCYAKMKAEEKQVIFAPKRT